MDEQAENITKILSYVYFGFNTIFILLLIISLLISTSNKTKSLKIKFLILIIIDSIQYFFNLYNSKFFGELYYELFIKVIYSCQIYLFISIFKIMIEMTKLKKMKDLDKSLYSYQFALISFFILLSYNKIFNIESIIINVIQNVVILFVVYSFYKSLYNPIILLLNKLKKKYISKIQITKNLKFILNMSLFLIFGKIIINIILILFVDENYQHLLSMPLNMINYLKYFDYTTFLFIIFQIETIQLKRDDETFDKLKENTNYN